VKSTRALSTTDQCTPKVPRLLSRKKWTPYRQRTEWNRQLAKVPQPTDQGTLWSDAPDQRSSGTLPVGRLQYLFGWLRAIAVTTQQKLR